MLLIGDLLNNLAGINDREGNDVLAAGRVKRQSEHKLLAVFQDLDFP